MCRLVEGRPPRAPQVSGTAHSAKCRWPAGRLRLNVDAAVCVAQAEEVLDVTYTPSPRTSGRAADDPQSRAQMRWSQRLKNSCWPCACLPISLRFAPYLRLIVARAKDADRASVRLCGRGKDVSSYCNGEYPWSTLRESSRPLKIRNSFHFSRPNARQSSGVSEAIAQFLRSIVQGQVTMHAPRSLRDSGLIC